MDETCTMDHAADRHMSDEQLSDEQIAKICHMANDLYTIETQQTPPTPRWEDTSVELREGAIRGVAAVRADPTLRPPDIHAIWMTDRIAHGWVYAPQLDRARKHHPNLVAWDDLSHAEQRKDALFIAIVRACIATAA